MKYVSLVIAFQLSFGALAQYGPSTPFVRPAGALLETGADLFKRAEALSAQPTPSGHSTVA